MNRHSAQAILIVDDDPCVTDTFSRLLQLKGFTVYAALSPEGGLEIAANKQTGCDHPGSPDADPERSAIPPAPTRDSGAAAYPGRYCDRDYFVDDRTQSAIEALGASVLFKPIWLDELLALARILTTV